jgi:hypothetical protein
MRRRLAVVVSLVALAATAVVAPAVGTAGAQATDPPPSRPDDLGATSVQPLSPTDRLEGDRAPSSRLAESDQDLLDRTDATPVRVLVKLDYDAVASYHGGVDGTEATSPSVTGEALTPEAVRTSDYVREVVVPLERSVIADVRDLAPDVRIGRRPRVVFGGFSALLPADRAAAVAELPGVVAVQEDTLEQPLTDASTDFIDAPPAWDDLGGQALAGQGVLFGSLDTGVWPEHPSFADNPDLGPAPLDNQGDPLTCNFGDDPLTPGTSDYTCNDKLVGGDVFLDSYFLDPDVPDEFYPTTARDSDGHGTHTSSTAAGDIVDEAPIFGVDRGPISGVAPGAWVSVYKVCGEEGCAGSDSAAAVEQAIFDGVDVINFSISGGSDPFSDPVELAFLDAYDAGVFVAASAGNSGPAAATSDHLSPWVTTVGASTQTREFATDLELTADGGATATFHGSTITPGVDAATPVVLAEDVAGYGDAECTDEPPADDTFAGLVVACRRGGESGRVQKGFNLDQGGAEGMILYNPALADTETDNHWLPAVHLADGTEFLAFLADNTNVAATWADGSAQEGHGDVVAGFSSRGPAGNFVKPDVTAPGVQILAGHTPTPQVIDVGPEGEYFQAIAGTSMSSPHVAGAGILLAALHDDWTPGQIKSALMTTAITDLVKEDETTPADPFDIGSGRIDVGVAADPGLTVADDAEGFFAWGGDPVTAVDENIPSVNAPIMPGSVTTHRVVTNVSSGTAVYAASTTAPDGTSITVSPAHFSIAAGASRTLTIVVSADEGVEGQQFGQIDLSAPGRHDLHLPVAFVPGQGEVSLTTDCAVDDVTVGDTASCDITASNGSSHDTTVDLRAHVDDHLEITDAHPGSATHTATDAHLESVALEGRDPGVPSLEAWGDLGEGYLPGIDGATDPIAVGDEEAVNYDVAPFLYNGVTYDRIGLVSNGYAVVGGVDSTADIQCCPPQQLPDGAPPNNILAPFWADLTGEGDAAPAPGGFYAATVGGGAYTVFEFRLNAFGTDDLKVFQLWIGHDGVQDISFNYGDVSLDGITPSSVDPENGGLTIGAENEVGDGEQLDAAPEDDDLPTVDIAVVSTDPSPADEATLTVDVAGANPGTGTVRGELRSPIVSGVTRVSDQIEVFRAATELDSFVAQAYLDLFDRDPTDSELDAAVSALQSGTTRTRFVTGLTQTDEWRGVVVDRLYELVLDRAPTAGERITQVARLANGTTEKALVGRLGGSSGFYSQAGGTDAGFVDLLFQRLVGHSPSTATRNNLVAQIEGGRSRATVATRVYQRQDSRNQRVDALFDQYLHRAPTAERRAHYAQVLVTKSDTFVVTKLVGSQEYFTNATS